ncbi:MAG: hypothetical protein HYT08_02785 [Candidatus Levybacteria bacterium]|nr:hypothetical protein [Candidatus Levybacteria bacterium]
MRQFNNLLNVKRSFKIIKKNALEILFVISSLVFSFWLMFSTFSYQNGSFRISSKVWSDFASALPLIRSFSQGANFPPEYPLFPGEPIRYHFLFYLMVGGLEKIGFPIDFSLNILSSISFLFLMMMIYLLAKKMFNSKSVGILSVVLFLFNGSLSFIEFFRLHPPSLNTINDIIINVNFPSFGPYDGKIVSAFWNLNIYTNQRHLALSFALLLFLIYLNYPTQFLKKNIFLISINSFLVVTLFFLNQPAFMIALLFLLFFLIFEIKKILNFGIPFVIGVILFFIYSLSFSLQSLSLRLGFLTPAPLNAISFLNYWISNFGLYLILIPVSFLIIPKKLRLFLLPLLVLFLAGNLFQFSRDIINNHKFFNFILIVGGIFVSNLIVSVWKKGKIINKTACVIIFTVLVLSGIIDLMPIKNDSIIIMQDAPNNPDIAFILNNTNPKDIILNSRFLYHPASLAGRPIFYGYPYFAWSYGYNTQERERIYLEIFRSPSKQTACNLLKKYNISYIELSDVPEEFINPNLDLWEKEFKKIYYNSSSDYALYDVADSCLSINSSQTIKSN